MLSLGTSIFRATRRAAILALMSLILSEDLALALGDLLVPSIEPPVLVCESEINFDLGIFESVEEVEVEFKASSTATPPDCECGDVGGLKSDSPTDCGGLLAMADRRSALRPFQISRNTSLDTLEATEPSSTPSTSSTSSTSSSSTSTELLRGVGGVDLRVDVEDCCSAGWMV